MQKKKKDFAIFFNQLERLIGCDSMVTLQGNYVCKKASLI